MGPHQRAPEKQVHLQQSLFSAPGVREGKVPTVFSCHRQESGAPPPVGIRSSLHRQESVHKKGRLEVELCGSICVTEH
jgi:hypothetical protein